VLQSKVRRDSPDAPEHAGAPAEGDEPYTEFVCAEGNLNLFDYGIPVAKTPDF